MKWNALDEEPCSVARTVAVIGDRMEPFGVAGLHPACEAL